MTIIILDSIIKMKKRADKNIKTYRDYLEESASRGNREAINAIKELDSPFDILSPYDKTINQNIKRKIWKPKEEVINLTETMTKESNTVGRPTIMTQEIIDKLEYVFSLGGTDKEACLYAGISHQTLYSYQDKYPEFVERKEALKENPVLKARETVVKALDDPKDAQWFLERKRKSEFSVKQELEHSGEIKQTLTKEQVDELINRRKTNNTSGEIQSN